jgi:hypothetical protein
VGGLGIRWVIAGCSCRGKREGRLAAAGKRWSGGGDYGGHARGSRSVPGQHSRLGIIAATSPAVRVLIMNPTPPIGIAGATP